LDPTLVGKELRKHPRTLAHEQFAVATLIFMILMGGKAPYSRAGGASPTENLVAAEFPYCLGEERRTRNAPKGVWRFIWSHLPFRIKTLFHETFVDQKRPTLEAWRSALEAYLKGLAQDWHCDQLFPRTLKAMHRPGEPPPETRVCLRCKTLFPILSFGRGHHPRPEPEHCHCCREILQLNRQNKQQTQEQQQGTNHVHRIGYFPY
jgi:hypothetical protein